MKSKSEIQLHVLLSKKSSFYLKRFPSFNIKRIKTVILFGAGQMGTIYLDFFTKLKIEVVVFCDNDLNKVGQKINKISIIGTKSLANYSKNTPIIITSIFDDQIHKQLKKMGFSQVWSHTFLATFYSELFPNPYWTNPINSLLKNKNNLLKTIGLFSDQMSKQTFLNVIKYRLFLDNKYIGEIKNSNKNEYFDKEIIHISGKEVFVDGGAFDGDTIKRFVNTCKQKYKKIFAFEPDKSSFDKLNEFVQGLNDHRVKIYKYGLAEKIKTIRFSNDGTLGSRFDDDGNQKIEVINLDKLILKENVSMMKLDVEGAEMDALIGAKKIIHMNKPKLIVCIYHKPNDIWQLPLFINNLNPNYKLYLRHYSNFLYDTVCYAI